MMIDRSMWRRALNLLAVVAVVSLLLVVVVSAVPQLVGADESYVVLSGSMEPEIGVGDNVIVNRVDPADIAVGDVITFRVDGQSNPTTHRVVDVVDEGEMRSFLTKGDANEEADPRPITESELIGRVLVTIPLVGYLFTFLDTPIGYVLFIGVPFGLLVLSELWSFAAANRDGGTATGDADAESTTDPDSATEASSVDASTDAGSSGVTVTRRDLRVLLPVTVFFGLYTVWNAIQSPGSTVHVGVAAAMVLLSVFLVVLYLSLGESSTGTASPETDRSAIGIRIDGSIDDSAGYTDGSDSVRVASIRELAVLAQEKGRPIAVDDGLRWYQVTSNGDRYLYDAGGARMPIEADVLGEPRAGNGGGSADTLEGDQ